MHVTALMRGFDRGHDERELAVMEDIIAEGSDTRDGDLRYHAVLLVRVGRLDDARRSLERYPTDAPRSRGVLRLPQSGARARAMPVSVWLPSEVPSITRVHDPGRTCTRWRVLPAAAAQSA